MRHAINRYIGDFGRYQTWIYGIGCLSSAITGSLTLAFVVTGYIPSHRCLLPGTDTDLLSSSFDIPRLNEIYYDDDAIGKEKIKSFCSYCPDNIGQSSLQFCNESEAVPCPETMVYDNVTDVHSSLAMKFDMVCSDEWKHALLKSMTMLGFLLGSAGMGMVSDRFGRKTATVIGACCLVVVSNVLPFAPTFTALCVIQVLMTFFAHGTMLTAFTAVMELVGGWPATLCGVFYQAPFALGIAYVGLLSYVIKDWRTLHWAISCWSILLMILVWFMDESCRWLMAEQRQKAAIRVLKKIVRFNRANVDEQEVFQALMQEPKTEHVNFFKFFHYPILARNSWIIFLDWAASSISYYGLSFNTSDLPMDRHLSLIVSGLIEIPGFVVAVFAVHRFGRRSTMSFLTFLAGFCLVGLAFLPLVAPAWLVSTVAMIGKLCSAAAFSVIYVYSAELFPTVVRNTGIGISSCVSRIAAMLAPQIHLLGSVAPWIPNLIYGVVSIAAAVLNLLLPETRNRELPESIEDALYAARNRNA